MFELQAIWRVIANNRMLKIMLNIVSSKIKKNAPNELRMILSSEGLSTTSIIQPRGPNVCQYHFIVSRSQDL